MSDKRRYSAGVTTNSSTRIPIWPISSSAGFCGWSRRSRIGTVCARRSHPWLQGQPGTRSFASLGDQLFWLGLHPTLLLLACLLAWWGQSGLVLALLGSFALGQLLLRARALSVGYRLGMDIVELLVQPAGTVRSSGAKQPRLVLLGAMVGLVLSALQGPAAPLSGLTQLVC